MSTAARRKSTHGNPSAGSSSSQAGRRPSASKQGGGRGRFDPSLMMSSNAADAEGSRAKGADLGPRRKSVDEFRAHERAARRNKSTDRLHRAGESSTNLTGKRSKSQIQLAMTSEGNSKRRKDSSGNRQQSRRPMEDSEDGWTSASAAGTPSDSAEASPSSSPVDEGLVLGIKKRQKPQQTAPTIPTDTAEPPNPPDTPRAKVKHFSEEVSANLDETSQGSPSSKVTRPAPMERHDTSGTLRDESLAPTPSSSSSAQPDPEVTALNRDVANLRLVTDSVHSAAGSDVTLAHDSSLQIPEASTNDTASHTANGSSAQAGEPSRPSHHQRVPSTASNRTLRNSMPLASSPVSVRSRSSILSNVPYLYPRESHGIVPPKLDTHNALAGALGSRYEDRGDMAGGSRSNGRHSLPPSASEPAGLDGMFPEDSGSRPSLSTARRKGSLSSMTGSGISMPSPSPSMGNVSRASASRGLNNFNSTGRSQRLSVNSLRDSGSLESSEVLSPDRKRTSSTQSLSATDAAKLAAKLRLARDSMDEQSAANALRGAGGSGILGGQRGAANPRLEKYNKPVISSFAKNVSSIENPVAHPVTEKSVFSAHFAEPHEVKGKAVAHRPMLRYVMGYGLSGPPAEQGDLSAALLGPSLDMDDFESSWAPALANAAGLGSRSMRHPSRNVEPEFGVGPHDAGTSVNGPNSTPLYQIHGLTTTSPDPFPLDPSDVPALQEGGDLFDHGTVKYVDPGLIRAIALTSQAISTHRAHVVTRRYADPMRESLERMARSSGKWGLLPPPTPRRTAPNSPADPQQNRPTFSRRKTSEHQSQLASIVDAAEHPVRSLKRVWSGGISRGGLAALTRTDE